MTIKLVRDRYDEFIPVEALSVADQRAIVDLLDDKLTEEIQELRESKFRDPVEFADVIEVLAELACRNGVGWDVIEMTRQEKLRDRGGFKKGVLYDPGKDPTRR